MMLKLTPEVTLIGAPIVLKFKPCTAIISEVIAKSVHDNFFKDHPFGTHFGHISIPFKTIVPN